MFWLAAALSLHLAADNGPKVASIDDFKKCADEYSWDVQPCVDALNVYVKKKPSENFAAGKAVRLKLNHYAALPFFERALTGKFDAARCSDEDLGLAVVAGLGLPAADAAVAQKLLADKCWAGLKERVAKELAGSGSGYLTDNACPVFAKKNENLPACVAKPAEAATVAQEEPWKEIERAKVQVEGPAKVFAGDEGRRVTLVRVKGDAQAVLVKFEGVRGPWNNKVVLHRERPAASGYDYFTLVDGSTWVSIVARSSFGGGDLSYELHPAGDKGPFMLGYSDAASKAVKPEAVLAEWRKR